MTQENQQNVPNLRFPGYEETWTTRKLGDLGPVSMCKRVMKDETTPLGDVPFFKIGTFGREADAFIDRELFERYRSRYPFPKVGDILISAAGTIGRLVVYDGKPAYFQDSNIVWVANDESEVINGFLLPCYQNVRWTTEDTTIARLYNDNLREIDITAPTLPEQRKIAEFLKAVDTKIAHLADKKRLLGDYKKGCMQQLFSQKIRFKDNTGSDFPDWEEKPLHSFLTETKAKSDGTEAVFSVSVHKGLIDQVEHLGRSFSAADTNHYNRVEPGDIVYTKSPTGDFPYGIIKQSRLDTSVIVSPLYGVFRPETFWLGYWLHVYFESSINTGNYLKPIIQKGAKNTINITNTTFLSAQIKVPVHPDEQRKIADFLSALDRKIGLVNQELEHAQKFKKGLLQQMFV